jgi:hypothetical protein
MVEEEKEGTRLVRETLDAAGVPVRSIERIVPSLEDVFLYLLDNESARRGEEAKA